MNLEICAISTTASKKDIGRCFKQIVSSLPNSNRPDSIDIKNLVVSCHFRVISSRKLSFIKPRFCNQLELRQENLIQKTAVFIAERAKEICDIQSRAPDSIAGASIYMACAAAGEKKPMKGKATFITKFSIINHFLQIFKSQLVLWKALFEQFIKSCYSKLRNYFQLILCLNVHQQVYPHHKD